jgi:hypothetical protein
MTTGTQTVSNNQDDDSNQQQQTDNLALFHYTILFFGHMYIYIIKLIARVAFIINTYCNIIN